MGILIGIDGGGTKTAVMAYDTELNTVVSNEIFPSCSTFQFGIDIFKKTIADAFEKTLQISNAEKSDVLACCFGVPGYGEDLTQSKLIDDVLAEIFEGIKFKAVNDVEVGWAGSLLLGDGVNIVAGTGAIMFGMNAKGEYARSSGWGEFAGDEGSAYWLGKKTIEIFSKQADGRYEKGKLYDIMMNHFKLSRPLDFIGNIYNHLINNRTEVAKLQMLLLEAAKANDTYAIKAYNDAAEELFIGTRAVAESLGLLSKNTFKVSYSGGVFKVGDLILAPLKAKLDTIHAELVEPKLSPCSGALLIAAKEANLDFSQIANSLRTWEA